MRKNIILTIMAGVIVIGGLSAAVIVWSGKTNRKLVSASSAATLTPAQELGQPARQAEIKGTVKSIEGNDLIIANEIDTIELTPEQQAAKKAERQAMSQEERQALKAQETAAAKIENVNVQIPVGVPIKKTTGDATGNLQASDLSEIKEGAYISIWINDYKTQKQSIVFVKLKSTTN